MRHAIMIWLTLNVAFLAWRIEVAYRRIKSNQEE
jgi:hypothetical protein